MKFYQKNVHRPILVGYKHSATSKLATRFCTSLWNERSPKPATFKGKTWFSLRENLIFLWFFSLFFQKFPTKYLFHSTKKNRLLKKNKNYENGKNIFRLFSISGISFRLLRFECSTHKIQKKRCRFCHWFLEKWGTEFRWCWTPYMLLVKLSKSHNREKKIRIIVGLQWNQKNCKANGLKFAVFKV